MKTKFLIIISVIAITTIPEAQASCATFVPIFDDIRAYGEANTVFVGEVIDVYHPHKKGEPGVANDEFTFNVEYYLKGDLKDDKVVSSHSSVGYDDFVLGESYFVYAFAGINEVSQCSPPILSSDVGHVLVLLFFIQYSCVAIPLGIGGIIFGVWRARR